MPSSSARHMRAWVWALLLGIPLCTSQLFAGPSVEPLFRRGDANASGRIEFFDALATLEALFVGRTALSCRDAADANDDGVLDIGDPLLVLFDVFVGRVEIPDPGPTVCGRDPTRDDLDCESYAPCLGPRLGIDWSRAYLAFAEAEVGATSVLPLALENLGTESLSLAPSLREGADFELEGAPEALALPPGEGLAFGLRFSPRVRGLALDGLVLETNDPDLGAVEIPIWGEARAQEARVECRVEADAYLQRLKVRVATDDRPDGLPGLRLRGMLAFDPWPFGQPSPRFFELQGETGPEGDLTLAFPKFYFTRDPAPIVARVAAEFFWEGDETLKEAQGDCVIEIPPNSSGDFNPLTVTLRALDRFTGEEIQGTAIHLGDTLEVTLWAYLVARIDRVKILVHLGRELRQVVELREETLNWSFPAHCASLELDSQADYNVCQRQASFRFELPLDTNLESGFPMDVRVALEVQGQGRGSEPAQFDLLEQVPPLFEMHLRPTHPLPPGVVIGRWGYGQPPQAETLWAPEPFVFNTLGLSGDQGSGYQTQREREPRPHARFGGTGAVFNFDGFDLRLQAGQERRHTLTIENFGDAELVLESPELVDEDAEDAVGAGAFALELINPEFTIAPGATRDLELSLRPQSGAFPDLDEIAVDGLHVVLRHNAPEPEIVVPIAGRLFRSLAPETYKPVGSWVPVYDRWPGSSFGGVRNRPADAPPDWDPAQRWPKAGFPSRLFDPLVGDGTGRFDAEGLPRGFIELENTRISGRLFFSFLRASWPLPLFTQNFDGAVRLVLGHPGAFPPFSLFLGRAESFPTERGTFNYYRLEDNAITKLPADFEAKPEKVWDGERFIEPVDWLRLAGSRREPRWRRYNHPNGQSTWWVEEEDVNYDLDWDGKLWSWRSHRTTTALRAALPPGISPLIVDLELFDYFLRISQDEDWSKEMMRLNGREEFLRKLEDNSIGPEIVAYIHDTEIRRELLEFSQNGFALVEEWLNTELERVQMQLRMAGPRAARDRGLKQLMLHEALQRTQRLLRQVSGGNLPRLLQYFPESRRDGVSYGPGPPPVFFKENLRSHRTNRIAQDNQRMRRLRQASVRR